MYAPFASVVTVSPLAAPEMTATVAVESPGVPGGTVVDDRGRAARTNPCTAVPIPGIGSVPVVTGDGVDGNAVGLLQAITSAETEAAITP